MHFYTCSTCKDHFDAGELRGGVCEECRRKEQELENKLEMNQKILARNVIEQADGQLMLGGIAN